MSNFQVNLNLGFCQKTLKLYMEFSTSLGHTHPHFSSLISTISLICSQNLNIVRTKQRLVFKEIFTSSSLQSILICTRLRIPSYLAQMHCNWTFSKTTHGWKRQPTSFKFFDSTFVIMSNLHDHGFKKM